MFRFASWYAQLASLTHAGVPLPEAVRRAAGPPNRVREALAGRLESGEDPREIWPSCGIRLTMADSLVLAAGQLSGRFPEVCGELAERHAALGRLRARMLVGLLYPLFLIHAVLILSPFIRGVDLSGSASPTLGEILVSGAIGAACNLGGLWAVILAGWCVFSRWPGFRGRVLRVLPLCAGVVTHGALATFAGTLASLLRAGVPIARAWEFAAKASDDPRILGASAVVVRAVEDRAVPPGRVMDGLGAFPGEFVSLYVAGERAGSLEARLDELRARHVDSALNLATAASILYPMLVSVLAMALAAAKVLGFYTGYLDQIRNLAQ